MKKCSPLFGLGKEGREFWERAMAENELTEAHDFERLAMACKTLDDLAEIEARVKVDGLFTVNRYGSTVEHPGCKMIRDLRMLFLKTVRELGLDLVDPGDGRPPRQY